MPTPNVGFLTPDSGKNSKWFLNIPMNDITITTPASFYSNGVVVVVLVVRDMPKKKDHKYCCTGTVTVPNLTTSRVQL